MVFGDAVTVVVAVVRVLEGLGVRYLVGGSLASSLLGIPRATQDVDIVVDLKPDHVDGLLEALTPDFYVDEDAVRDALHRRSMFNVIHLATMFKADLILMRHDPLSAAEMTRGLTCRLGEGDELIELQVASAEDIILQKLDWFRRGGEVSGRQWTDVLGVMKTNRGRLDEGYLRLWAGRKGLLELLDGAFDASKPGSII